MSECRYQLGNRGQGYQFPCENIFLIVPGLSHLGEAKRDIFVAHAVVDNLGTGGS
jgi:hypothetical protein